MSRSRKWIWLSCILFIASAPAVSARTQPAEKEGVLVGRISHVEGQLLRYVPEEQDWVATVKDAPFGLDDAVYSEQEGSSEFIMPNNSWIRIGGSTQIQLLTLKTDVTAMDVASGVARFYSKGNSAVIKATTPFGYVMAQPDSIFDLYVGDQSMEVIAIKGEVDFIHEATGTRYEVMPGSSSVVADERLVTAGEGQVDADWDDWNAERERIWSKRLEVKGDSVRYLPPAIRDDAYALEEHGRWERVRYENSYRYFWRPVNVGVGWTPFSAGRWTVWYGDNCWIPHEPFGYVTHHYGNWVYVGNYWYWAPPAPAVSVGVGVAPGLGIGINWYPGRVAWIHSGVNVGWVPLAPMEPYYTHRHWGPRTVVVSNVTNINIHINRFRYVDHAVVINQNNFYSVNNYHDVRVRNINRTTIINNYRPAPVVNNTVINNYTKINQRYNFTNVNVVNKPHRTVVNRISRNEQIARDQARGWDARVVRDNVGRAKRGEIDRRAAVDRPRVTNRIVPAAEVNKPQDAVRFQQRELKQRVRPVKEVQGAVTDDRRQRRDLRPEEPRERPDGSTSTGDRIRPPGQRDERVRGEQTREPRSPRQERQEPSTPRVQERQERRDRTEPGVQERRQVKPREESEGVRSPRQERQEPSTPRVQDRQERRDRTEPGVRERRQVKPREESEGVRGPRQERQERTTPRVQERQERRDRTEPGVRERRQVKPREESEGVRSPRQERQERTTPRVQERQERPKPELQERQRTKPEEQIRRGPQPQQDSSAEGKRRKDRQQEEEVQQGQGRFRQ